MRPILPLSALAFASLFTLGGCLSGDDDAPKPIVSGSVEVLSIDRAAGTIQTRTTVTECASDGSSSLETETDSERFAIRDGKLIIWDEEECTSTILSGTSADIVGTWTGTAMESGSPIPGDLRPADCPDYVEPDPDMPEFLQDVTANYAISEDKIVITATGTVCMADAMLQELIGDPEIGGEVSVVSKACNEFVIANPLGQKASVKTSMSDNRVSVRMSSGGRTCGFSLLIPMPGHPVDCEAQARTMEQFEECTGGGAAGKVSGALAKSATKLF